MRTWSAADRVQFVGRAAGHPVVVLAGVSTVLLVASFVVPNRISPVADEGAYLYYAHNLLNGGYAGATFASYLWHGPGLPVVLLPFVAAHAPLALIRLVSPAFLAATCCATYLLLRPHVPRGVALIAGACLVVYLPFYGVIHHIYAEPLTMFLIVSGFAAIGRYLRSGSKAGLAIAALALGWAAMTRVEFGWVLILSLSASVVGWLGTHRSQSMGRLTVVYVCALLVCAPWLVYTYTLTGNVLYWGNSGGLSLYWVATPNSHTDGDWHAPGAAFTNPALAPDRPVFRHASALSPASADAYLMNTALKDIRAHPLNYLKNIADNIGRLIVNMPYSFTSPSLFTALLAAINIAVVLVFGAMIARGRSVLRAMPPELWAAAGFALAAFIVHAAVAAYPRMSFPTDPLLLAIVTWTAWRARLFSRAGEAPSVAGTHP